MSRKDLQQKLRPLSAAGRAVFKPLDLGELPPEEAAPVKLDKPVAAKADDRKNGDKTAADKAAADKASTEKTADKMVLDKAAADKAAADKAAADKLAADKQKRAEKSLFAEALAADKPAGNKPTIPAPPQRKDEVVRLDDSIERLIVSEDTARKPS